MSEPSFAARAAALADLRALQASQAEPEEYAARSVEAAVSAIARYP